MSSLLDRMYARYSNRRLFFRQGWGDMGLLKGLSPDWLQERAQAKISISWDKEENANGIRIRQGRFAIPFEAKGFPPESGTAYMEMILPTDENGRPPVCLHLAATGDEGFKRRRKALALPLAKRGIGSLILENPYYGKRRPPGQHSKMLKCVSDLILMGSAALTEGRVLLAWLCREGYSRTGVSGISMGGHMAALIGALSPEPVAIAPCIAPHSPSAVFLDGVLSRYCAWNALNNGHHGPEEAREFMTGLLDIMDIRRYPPPQAPAAACLVAARSDAYIPLESAAKLHRHWPGASLRWLEGGHVGAFLFHRGVFTETIVQAFSRL
jgi:pimeloyl-ACP methyl ester carboxylesterase